MVVAVSLKVWEQLLQLLVRPLGFLEVHRTYVPFPTKLTVVHLIQRISVADRDIWKNLSTTWQRIILTLTKQRRHSSAYRQSSKTPFEYTQKTV